MVQEFLDLTIALLSHQMPPKRDEAALQEEEELQLAIALSQSEAEEKERMVGCTADILLCILTTSFWKETDFCVLTEAEKLLLSVSQS